MKVLFLPEVSQQFVELAEILYDKGYLSFLDDAIEYSDSLFRQIQRDLPIRVHRDAPAYFDRYGKGMSYAAFTKNKHTPGMFSSTCMRLQGNRSIWLDI